MFANFKHSRTIIYAPLAGISDSPARRLARKFGADATVTELIAIEGIIRKCQRTMELTRFDDSERPLGIQLFGADPDHIIEAAKIVETLNPDFIDINFGCPARKIVERNGGSSILRDLQLLEKIVSGVVKAVRLPVTVKTRSGWDATSLVYLKAGKIAEDCGAAAIAFHPRTKEQYFSGASDWSQIARLKETLSIPVIGNGDVCSPEDAKRMFDETGCDAVMIGRGSIGNPWIFNRTKHYLTTGELLPEPSWRQKIETALEHLDAMIAYYGNPRGIFKMRSHFCHYLKGMPGSAGIRVEIIRLTLVEEIQTLLLEYVAMLEAQRLETNIPLPVL
jgi:tRNA-dihydrouridine synthase B